MFADKLLKFSEYETDVFPEPNKEPPEAGTRVPKESLQVPGFEVLYLKYPVVAPLLGLALPFNLAEDEVVLETEVVVATGGSAGAVGVPIASLEFDPSPTAFTAVIT